MSKKYVKLSNILGLFSGKIVYNTFDKGNWSEHEQRISSPYKADEEFDIRVRILGGKYQVSNMILLSR